MRLFIRPDRREWPSILQRPTRSTLDMIGVVNPIFDAVRERGDEALREFTLQFDGAQIEAINIPPDELEASARRTWTRHSRMRYVQRPRT